ncbi:hypothetical protein Peur_016362 [Populus x canadensis]
MKETEKKSLDPQPWQACAGSMLKESISLILCRVATVKFLADPDTDEVYAKIGVFPLPPPKRDFVVNDDSGPLPIPIPLCRGEFQR